MPQPFLTDWVTRHIPVWTEHLAEFRGEPNIHFLEIGSWEGRSAEWLLQNILTHETACITCIDPFPVIGGAAIRKHAANWGLAGDLPESIRLEERFDDTIAAIHATRKVTKIVGMSQDVLRTLPVHSFDAIYVDGSHFTHDVLRDVVWSFDLLKDGGILIMDDYLLNTWSDEIGDPQPAIDGFLNAYEGQYALLHKDWQVIIRKTARDVYKSDHPVTGVPWHLRADQRTTTWYKRDAIVSVTTARNEADILEAFVRHNARVVDHMIIMLHCCTDASRDILRTLFVEGYSIKIRESHEPHHAQSEFLTAMMRSLADAECRWIVPLDADEFLCAANDNPRGALLSTEPENVYEIPWKTYVPTPGDDPHERDPLLRIGHRRATEPRQFTKVLVPGAIAKDAVLPLGSHTVMNHAGQRHGSTLHPSLFLAHFPVRSATQLRRKVIDGWEAHCRNPNANKDQIFQWRALYERCKNPLPILPEELRGIALRYATFPGDPLSELIRDPLTETRPTRITLVT